MSDAAHLMLVVGLAAIGKAIIQSIWSFYKKRPRVIPMRLRNGIHEPWGFIEKVQKYGGDISVIYMILLAFCFVILIVRSYT